MAFKSCITVNYFAILQILILVLLYETEFWESAGLHGFWCSGHRPYAHEGYLQYCDGTKFGGYCKCNEQNAVLNERTKHCVVKPGGNCKGDSGEDFRCSDGHTCTKLPSISSECVSNVPKVSTTIGQTTEESTTTPMTTTYQQPTTKILQMALRTIRCYYGTQIEGNKNPPTMLCNPGQGCAVWSFDFGQNVTHYSCLHWRSKAELAKKDAVGAACYTELCNRANLLVYEQVTCGCNDESYGAYNSDKDKTVECPKSRGCFYQFGPKKGQTTWRCATPEDETKCKACPVSSAVLHVDYMLKPVCDICHTDKCNVQEFRHRFKSNV